MATRAWLPSDATSATLVGWLDAQDASTLTVEAGGGVSAWRSKVGGWGVTQTTAGNQPPYSTYNNLPAVFPTADSQFLSGTAPSALPTGGDAGSMTGVATVIAYRNTYSTLFYWGSANQNKARSIAATGNAVSSGYYGNDVQGNVAWPGFTRLFISSISATGYAEQWVDGGPVQGAQKNVLSTPATSTFWVGRSINGDPWRNPIQEICLWKGTLSADERAKLEGYYAWRWNLVSQLPASHAYKAAAPTINDSAGGEAASGATALGNIATTAGGALVIMGGAALALASVAVTSLGAAAVSGSAGVSLQPIGAAGSGGSASKASLSTALSPLTSSGLGLATLASSGSPIVAPVVGTGSGSSTPIVGGQGAATLAPVTLAAFAASSTAGTATSTLGRIGVVGTGRTAAGGTGAIAMGGVSAAGGVAALIVGQGSSQLASAMATGRASGVMTGSGGGVLGVIVGTGKGSPPAPAIIVPPGRSLTLTTTGSRRLALSTTGSRRLTI